MRDIFAVLSQKEAELKKLQSDIEKLQAEIETLRAAALLLVEEHDGSATSASDASVTVMREGAPHKEARVAAGGLRQFP
jgi:hypothetical protein